MLEVKLNAKLWGINQSFLSVKKKKLTERLLLKTLLTEWWYAQNDGGIELIA